MAKTLSANGEFRVSVTTYPDGEILILERYATLPEAKTRFDDLLTNDIFDKVQSGGTSFIFSLDTKEKGSWEIKERQLVVAD